MKVLLFGDGPALKEKGKVLREQNGWTVQLRSIQRWAGDIETTDAAYFLTPVDTIRAAYKARGIECFLVEEEAEPDDRDAAGETQPSETGAEADGEASEADAQVEKSGEGAADMAAEAKARRQGGKKAR